MVLTRARGDGADWADAIRAAGGRVLVSPCIAVRRLPATAARLARVADALARAKWLVLASRRAAAALAVAMERAGLTLPARLPVAAVGPATAALVRQVWRRRPHLPHPPTAHGLADLLLGPAGRLTPGDLVFAPGAREGTEILANRLIPAGIRVLAEPLYVTRPALGPLPCPASYDAVVLASPSAARAWRARGRWIREKVVVVIGPTTARAARDLGLTSFHTAQRPDANGVVAALTSAQRQHG